MILSFEKCYFFFYILKKSNNNCRQSKIMIKQTWTLYRMEKILNNLSIIHIERDLSNNIDSGDILNINVLKLMIKKYI